MKKEWIFIILLVSLVVISSCERTIGRKMDVKKEGINNNENPSPAEQVNLNLGLENPEGGMV